MPTIRDLITPFVQDPTANLRTPVSRTNYRQALQQLDSTNPGRDIRRWKEAHLAEHCLRPELASSSQRAVRNVLISFFSWAEYRGHVDLNPSRHLSRIVRPKMNPVRQHHWLSREEVRRVLGTCGPDPMGRRDHIVLMLGFHTGLRRSELAGLRWGHIHERHIEVLGKGRKAAQVPISRDLRAALDSWSQYCPHRGTDADASVAMVARASWGLGRESAVQLDWHRPLSTTGIYDVVRRRGTEAGFPDLATHDMRRTFAGLLDEAGVELRVIQGLLRHSSITQTISYLESHPRKGEVAMSTFRI